jgi:hypothetical protein
MLCQISGISNTVADVLVEKYGSMNGLMSGMKERHGTDYEAMSAEIGEMKYGKGHGRKIGIVGREIISQLFHIVLEEKIEKKTKVGKSKVAKKEKEKTVDLSNVFSDE